MTNLTQLPFTDNDYNTAEKIAARLGRKDNFAYTSHSDLIGFTCPRRFAADKELSIIKTKELGFLIVQTLEDAGLCDLDEQNI